MILLLMPVCLIFVWCLVGYLCWFEHNDATLDYEDSRMVVMNLWEHPADWTHDQKKKQLFFL